MSNFIISDRIAIHPSAYRSGGLLVYKFVKSMYVESLSIIVDRFEEENPLPTK